MPVSAALAFTQGIQVGAPGVAIIGTTAVPVVSSNGNNTGVKTFTFTMVDVPPGSTVPTGVVQTGSAPTYTFTPDVPGGYLLQLTVFDASGNFANDFRCFQVPETSGRIIPPFKGTDLSLNFIISSVMNLRGWAPFQGAYDKEVDILASAPGGAPIFGDNGAAIRATATGREIQNAQDGPYLLVDTGVSDGAESLFAGAAIGISENGGPGPAKIYFAGTTGTEGELWSFDLGSHRFEKIGSLQGPHNPDDLIAFGLTGNALQGVCTVGKGGFDAWGVGLINTDFGVYTTHSAGAENWTGGRLAVVFQNLTAPSSSENTVFWTAPLAHKVYADSFFGGSFTTPLDFTSVPDAPKAICKDDASNLWISLNTSNTIKRYSTSTTAGSGTLTPIGNAISHAGTIGIIHMIFDGLFIWTLSGTGVLAKLNPQDGSLIAHVTVANTTARSRLAYDGHSLWLSGGDAPSVGYLLVRIDPTTLAQVSVNAGNGTGGPEFRGIAVTCEGIVYFVSGGGGGHLFIESFEPPRGGQAPYKRFLTRATTSFLSGPSSYVALNLVTQPSLGRQSEEYTVTAIATSATSKNGFAWFKKRLRVQPSGAVVVGDPVDVDDSPKLNTQASTDGLGFSLAISSGRLVGTVIQTAGTNPDVYLWTIMTEQTQSDFNSWF